MKITRAFRHQTMAVIGGVLLLLIIITLYPRRNHKRCSDADSAYNFLWKDWLEVNGSSELREMATDYGTEKEPDTSLLRILVLTYKRSASLARCLASINAAEYDGFKVTLEIHIDRLKDNSVHNEILATAQNFVFPHGIASIHVKQSHAGILGQWLESWKVPEKNADQEIVVFVEDDITVSPYFARWLRRVHGKYDGYPGINGYTLQAEGMAHSSDTCAEGVMLQAPPGHTAFVYPVLGSWGFSPNTGAWRDFIKWYRAVTEKTGFLPLVPGLQPSDWYKGLLEDGREDTMWTIWHIYHAYQNNLYTVYPGGQGLSFNWKEGGEHYPEGLHVEVKVENLLETWTPATLRLPAKLVIVDDKGRFTRKSISPAGIQCSHCG